MELSSPVIAPGGAIPRAHTCEGENRVPPMAWSGVPEGAVTLLLTCDDPDAPRGTFRHWALYSIPPEATGVAAGGTLGNEAVNDFGKPGYAGPCPPRGDPPHRYVFRLAALKAGIPPDPALRCDEVRRLARPLEIASAELVGSFGR